MRDWRGRFPFTLAAPSWVLPLETDNFVGNVAWLARRVDKVQILCLGKDHVDDLLNPRDLKRLADIRRRSGLRYSVHLPSDLALLDPAGGATAQKAKLDHLARIIDLTAGLEPDNFILHLDPAPPLPPAAAGLPAGLATGLAALAPGRIQVENTDWDLRTVAAQLEAAGLGICADLGHLWTNGHSIPDFLSCFGPRIGELHLHGFGPGGDHLALTELPLALRPVVRGFLRDRRGSVTIENFRADWLEASLESLVELMAGQT